MIDILSNYTFQIVLLGSTVLGITAGTLGTFAFLRKQSLLGDAIAHATLPGVCLAFMLTQSKAALVLIIGAAITGWIGTLLMKLITDSTQLDRDTALGIILSVFFGFGLVLITVVQKMPNASKAGLDKFLFGNAATLLKADVTTMLVFSVIIFSVLSLFWKEFKLIVFDTEFAKSIGVRVHFFDIVLTTLIVAAIVIGLQTVGVVLMSAMLVAPAAAARQWTDKLSFMVILSALFGAISGVAGAVTSSLALKVPTGPTIVIFLSVFVIISLLFAPNRGLIWDWIRMRHHRQKIHTTTMLQNLMLFSEINTNPFHAHDIAALNAIGRAGISKTMRELAHKGLVRETKTNTWALTPQGLNEAKRLTSEMEGSFNESTSA